MRLELTGRHVDITPALRRMVDAKLARLERMLNNSALSAQVVLANEKRGHRADITLHARGEKFLHAVGSATAWEPSITQAIDKLVQQAQKIKGKWQERKRQGRRGEASGGGSGAEAAAGRVPAPPAPARVRARVPPIFRASRQAIKAMSVAEAAREAQAGGEGIVVFRDADTAGISVVFRRATGELTLVETEA
jgi:putative sigma-54 modulation protein